MLVLPPAGLLKLWAEWHGEYCIEIELKYMPYRGPWNRGSCRGLGDTAPERQQVVVEGCDSASGVRTWCGVVWKKARIGEG